MNISYVKQGTPEWFEVRAGKPTASNFDKIITTQGEPSKQKTKYLYKLAGEAVSGITDESYKSEAMARGNELEDEARSFYQLVNDCKVHQIGFCFSDIGAGCSPDGLIEDNGILEIKCPLSSTHIEYLLNGKLPSTYYQQVQGALFITGREWLDFISYYPGIKPFIIRVTPDEDFQQALERELKSFINELNIIITKIS